MSEYWWKQIIDKYNVLEKQLDTYVQNNLDFTQQLSSEYINIQKQMKHLEDIKYLADQAKNIYEEIEILNEILIEYNDQNEINHDDSSTKQQIQDNLTKLDHLYIEYQNIINHSNRPQMQSIILEIRPGVGGEEAALFAKSLFDMYIRLAEYMTWSYDIFTMDMTSIGGLDMGSMEITGYDCFKLMQYESGAHRIQRIPRTESKGRIHTSIATVVVLEQVDEDYDIDIDQKYLRIDTFRAGGAGGQHVNKTESAIRVTYEHPDLERIVISIQDEKSQHKNKAKAMKILKAKVKKQIVDIKNQKIATDRKIQIGSGDRHDKIRTYNVPQSRITDVRNNRSMYNLDPDKLVYPEDLMDLIRSIIFS